MKFWNGTEFVDPQNFKAWNGTEYRDVELYAWNGTGYTKLWPLGFPYRFPFRLGKGPIKVFPEPMIAEAECFAPSFSASSLINVPPMGGSAGMIPPGLSLSARLNGAVMTATAATSNPTLTFTHESVTTPFTASGTYTIPSWATHLVMVGVGGGEAGNNGSLFATGAAGKGGTWANQTIALASYPSLTSLSITVGNGGGSNGADGQASTVTGSGMPTLTCGGGSGGSGSQTGGSPGNTTVDGDLYTGGANASGGAAGNAPGGGGGGGNAFNGSGGGGARGQVWIKAKRIV